MPEDNRGEKIYLKKALYAKVSPHDTFIASVLTQESGDKGHVGKKYIPIERWVCRGAKYFQSTSEASLMKTQYGLKSLTGQIFRVY